MKSSCPQIHFVEEYFDGKLSPLREHQWRKHLVQCEDCTKYYNWHLMIPALSAADARDRMAKGLGLKRSRGSSLRWSPALLTALGSVLIVVLAVAFWPASSGRNGWTTRGGESHDMPCELVIYRMHPKSAPEVVKEQIDADDELAFSYRNGRSRRWLMVFGVDDAGKIYWYYPAWTEAQSDPLAVEISQDTAWHELPDAVSHSISSGNLFIYAVFSDIRLSVRQMEEKVFRLRPDSIIEMDSADVLVYPVKVVH